MSDRRQILSRGTTRSMRSDTRIVYIGAERVGLACLKRLVRMRKQIVGVLTAHEALRPQIADFTTFDALAKRHRLPLTKVTSSSDPEFARQIEALAPDLILVVSWSQLIPKAVIDLAPKGCVGIHYAVLPQRRGGAPLTWAILHGLGESGLTLYYLDDGLDTGDVIAYQRFAIGRHDTIKTLLDKIVDLAPNLLEEHLGAIEQGTAARVKQDESRASSTPRRRPADSEIGPMRSNEELYAFIRAHAPPYPSAFTFVGGRKLVIPKARLRHGTLWIQGYFA